MKACHWSVNNKDECDFWNTGCGEGHQFSEGGPRENKARFCCYCGGRLRIDRESAQAAVDAVNDAAWQKVGR